MRKQFRVYIIVFSTCILFTSCIDILEKLVLNKDGTGKYSMIIDMSGMMNDPMMKGVLESSEDNPIKDMDSMVYLKDLPDSIIKDNPDLWKRVQMRIYSNEKEKAFHFTIFLDFKHVDEIGYVSKNLDKVMSSAKGSPLSGGLGGEMSPTGMFTGGTSYSLSGKELTRTSEPSKTPEGDMDEMGMMKSFMAEATYKVIYELPGKVRNVTISNAKVDGKTVTTEISFNDLLEKKGNLDGTIKFK